MDRESAKYLSKLVNKFGKAINKSQGGVKISQFGREDEEKGAEVENERYSFAGKTIKWRTQTVLFTRGINKRNSLTHHDGYANKCGHRE